MKFSPLSKLNLSLLGLFIALFLAPGILHAAPSTLVIDEFMIAGESSSDSYLVIANYGTVPVDLSRYNIKRSTASGLERYTYTIFSSFGSFKLMPNSKTMICSDAFTGKRLKDTFVYPYDSTKKFSANNSILLIDGETIQDMVGYRDTSEITIKYFEGTPITPGPKAGQIFARDSVVEKDDNSKDFNLFIPPVVIDPNAARLVISEILPNPNTGESEWFEFYNPTNQDIGLGNLKICDAMGSTHCYLFDKNDVLAAGSYKSYGQSVTKITMNNDGDWLELYDFADNLITDSGGSYGAADKGISLALFGTDYRWTKTPTPGSQNIFADTIEMEVDTALPTPKTTKTKIVATKKTTVAGAVSVPEGTTTTDTAVKAAETAAPTASPVSHKTLGWALIGLAILLILGYICWYFRDYAKNIYDKIRRRDDSTRF